MGGRLDGSNGQSELQSSLALRFTCEPWRFAGILNIASKSEFTVESRGARSLVGRMDFIVFRLPPSTSSDAEGNP
jgi:hypothetical protein